MQFPIFNCCRRGSPPLFIFPIAHSQTQMTFRERRFHAFSEQIHHPLIQVVSHVTSPLTASLSIFLLHKSWQFSLMAPTARALALVRAPRAAAWAAVGAAGAGALLWGALASLPPRSVAEPDGAAAALRSKLEASRLFSPEDAPSVARHLATWRSAALAGDLLAAVHDRAGLSWWATIVGVTLGARVLLAPLQVGLLANSLRLKCILPEAQRLSAALRAAPAAAAAEPARQLLALLDAAQCSPFRQCLTFPLFLPAAILSVFGAMRAWERGARAAALRAPLIPPPPPFYLPPRQTTCRSRRPPWRPRARCGSPTSWRPMPRACCPSSLR